MNIYTNKEFAALALSNPKELLLAFQDIYINHYNGFNTKEDLKLIAIYSLMRLKFISMVQEY
jgi:hypothetical protein